MGGDKGKKRFNIVKYKEKYEEDRAAVEAMIPKSKNGETVSYAVAKLSCQKDNSAIAATGDVESQISPLTTASINADTKTNGKDNKVVKKRYVCFTFDNLNPMLQQGATSVLQGADEDTDPFRGLNDFVNVIVASCSPVDTEVLLIIASPGGYAFKFEQSYSDLLRLRAYGFRVTGLVDSICASGGYMLACGCDRIVCSPYAQLGSVGVIAQMHNYSKLLDKVGVEAKTFATGKYKAGFPTGEPYTEEDVATTRELIDETLQVFKGIVQSARKEANIEELLTARVWYGREALEKHMVDELMMTSDDYLSRLCRATTGSKNSGNGSGGAAGIEAATAAEVFLFELDNKPKGVLGSLLGSTMDKAVSGVSRMLSSLATGAGAAGSRLLRKSKPVGFVEL